MQDPLAVQLHFVPVGFSFMMTVSCNVTQFVGKSSLLSELKMAEPLVFWTAIILTDEHAVR